MNFESLLISQELGSNARILGRPESDNPYAKPEAEELHEEHREQLRRAWAFGWAIEDAVRHNETGIYGDLRLEAALAGSKVLRT